MRCHAARRRTVPRGAERHGNCNACSALGMHAYASGAADENAVAGAVFLWTGLSVSMSVRSPHPYLKDHTSEIREIFCAFCLWTYSLVLLLCIVIRYVLPVFWMTSCSTSARGGMTSPQQRLCIQCTTEAITRGRGPSSFCHRDQRRPTQWAVLLEKGRVRDRVCVCVCG